MSSTDAMNTNSVANTDGESEHLQRGLTNRHLQLIAIGGAIGTGLFLGSGKGISKAGPSIMLVYAIIGFFLFFMMRALGELLLSNLGYKSFRDIASDMIGPWAGFMVGWTYWVAWIVTAMADLIGISGYAAYFWPHLSKWVPALVVILVILSLNLVAVRMFGELEFWFAIIKVVTIVALIIVGIVLTAVAFQYTYKTGSGADAVSEQGRASFSNLINLHHGGIFPNGFSGFLAGFQIAIFAYVGIELVGTAAAETKNPEKNLPKAINSIPLRVALFYVVALAVILCVTPYAIIHEDPGVSPFVRMFTIAGIAFAAGLIDIVVMTSAASSANSGIYSTSRMVYGLSEDGDAPTLFQRLSKGGVPQRALILSVVFLLPVIILLYAGQSVIAAFTTVTTVSSVLFMFVWGIILISYLIFRRKRPQLHEKSTFKMPGGVFMAWASLIFFVLMIPVLCLQSDTRQAVIVTPIWFVILIVAWPIVKHDRAKKGKLDAVTPWNIDRPDIPFTAMGDHAEIEAEAEARKNH